MCNPLGASRTKHKQGKSQVNHNSHLKFWLNKIKAVILFSIQPATYITFSCDVKQWSCCLLLQSWSWSHIHWLFLQNLLTLIAGFIYNNLGNIRPQYRSKLSLIQLVAVFSHKHIKKYTLNTILKPIVDDIKQLVSVKIHAGRLMYFFRRMVTYLIN